MRQTGKTLSSVEPDLRAHKKGLRNVGLAVFFIIAFVMSAHAQQPTNERNVTPIRKITPVGPAVSTTSTLPRKVVITSDDVASFSSRLQEFSTGLSSAEQDIFYSLLMRAGAAPSDPAEGPEVKVRLFTSGLRMEGEEGPTGISMPGRPSQTGGAVGTSPVAVLREMLGPGNVSIGPKQDDPRARPDASGVLAIGPKQDDPRSPSATLASKMEAFGNSLSVKERAMLDWLMQRFTSSQSSGRGTPGGPRPSPERALYVALGIEAIGPKQDDPSPRPSAQSWALRF